MTPASSRRGSIDSLGKPLPEVSPASCQISLSLSYITSSAFRLPRYDLSLNTPTRSGNLVYRAEFCNTTSETWKDAKVTLSTSQTSFQGLGQPIPSLTTWHIRLSKMLGSQTDSSSGALVSTHGMDYKRKKYTLILLAKVANPVTCSSGSTASFRLLHLLIRFSWVAGLLVLSLGARVSFHSNSNRSKFKWESLVQAASFRQCCRLFQGPLGGLEET